jgi:LAGLIDADG endonuclease
LKILGLKTFLNLGLSEKLKEAFPNIIPVNRPEYIFKGIPDPFWVTGFISGDGSFYLIVKKLNSKLNEKIYFKVVLNFKICLHIRDEKVIKGLFDYFNLNKENINRSKLIYKTENTVTLHITKFSDIENIIIPFFEKYPVLGIKSLDFSDFKKKKKKKGFWNGKK